MQQTILVIAGSLRTVATRRENGVSKLLLVLMLAAGSSALTDAQSSKPPEEKPTPSIDGPLVLPVRGIDIDLDLAREEESRRLSFGPEGIDRIITVSDKAWYIRFVPQAPFESGTPLEFRVKLSGPENKLAPLLFSFDLESETTLKRELKDFEAVGDGEFLTRICCWNSYLKTRKYLEVGIWNLSTEPVTITKININSTAGYIPQ